MRKVNLARLASAIALSILAQPVAAQISEADRLQRCQNNRSMIEILQAESNSASLSRIAQLQRASEVVQRELSDLYDLADYQSDPRYAESQDQLVARAREIRARIRAIGELAGIYCAADDRNCSISIRDGIRNTLRNTRESMTPARRTEVERQLAMYRNNLVALRCDQARAPDVADIGGAWRSPNGSTYSITQSGNSFTWTRSGSDERATGTISGSSMNAQWASSQGSGGGSASIQFGANGVPVQIRWNNGNVFTR